jgi:hypothetical protein
MSGRGRDDIEIQLNNTAQLGDVFFQRRDGQVDHVWVDLWVTTSALAHSATHHQRV